MPHTEFLDIPDHYPPSRSQGESPDASFNGIIHLNVQNFEIPQIFL